MTAKKTVTLSEFTNPNGAYVYQVMVSGMPVTRELDSYSRALDAAVETAGQLGADIVHWFGDTGEYR